MKGLKSVFLIEIVLKSSGEGGEGVGSLRRRNLDASAFDLFPEIGPGNLNHTTKTQKGGATDFGPKNTKKM